MMPNVADNNSEAVMHQVTNRESLRGFICNSCFLMVAQHRADSKSFHSTNRALSWSIRQGLFRKVPGSKNRDFAEVFDGITRLSSGYPVRLKATGQQCWAL